MKLTKEQVQKIAEEAIRIEVRATEAMTRKDDPSAALPEKVTYGVAAAIVTVALRKCPDEVLELLLGQNK